MSRAIPAAPAVGTNHSLSPPDRSAAVATRPIPSDRCRPPARPPDRTDRTDREPADHRSGRSILGGRVGHGAKKRTVIGGHEV